MITIANPIYDVVFKFLMEDLVAARCLLSGLLGEDVEILELLPQERTLVVSDTKVSLLASNQKADRDRVSLMRFDYRATLRYKDRVKKVLIELQQSKNVEDIGRFRRYLGENYKSPDVRDGEEEYLPIIAIYLLGFTLNYQQALLRFDHKITDLSSDSPVDVLDDVMVEGLTHTSYFVQIPRLPQRYVNRIERVLAVFAQNWVVKNSHLMQVPDEFNNDPLIRPLLDRLELIIADPEVIRQVTEEESFERHFHKSIKKGIAEGIAQGKAEGITEGIAKGKAEGIAQGKAEGIAKGKEEGIAQGKAEGIAKGKEEGIAENRREMVRKLKTLGMPIQQITQITGLTESDIDAL